MSPPGCPAYTLLLLTACSAGGGTPREVIYVCPAEEQPADHQGTDAGQDAGPEVRPRHDAGGGADVQDDAGVPRPPRPGVADRDGDGVLDRSDNCPGVRNTRQADTDGDGAGDACDSDLDGDDVLNEADTCPGVPSRGDGDADGDGQGDACDPCPEDPDDDADRDGVCADADTCPEVPNPAQLDLDEDGLGDPCDDDADGDGIFEADDLCPRVADRAQEDLDGDGLGDACDGDRDGDGLVNEADTCPDASDLDQADADGDGLGDVCDPCPVSPGGVGDLDGDGLCDDVDVCPEVPDPAQADRDGDGGGDACDPCPDDPTDSDPDGDSVCGAADNCPELANPAQEDGDGDGRGDGCDPCPADAGDDRDGDGVCDGDDLCPLSHDPDQLDGDGDGAGDACDPCPGDALDDADGDGACGDADNCPDARNEAQRDSDGDGLGDACDPCDDLVVGDADGDGVCSDADNCPRHGNADQTDTDGDGAGDACDPCPADPLDDADEDGHCADADLCPDRYDPEQHDLDDDGAGDRCDADRDGDGVPDAGDVCPLSPDPGQEDRDGDGMGDACWPVLLFDDFEGGLDRWEVESGVWGLTEGRRRGVDGHALTDSPDGGSVGSSQVVLALREPVDLSEAAAPFLSAWISWELRDNQRLWVDVSVPGQPVRSLLWLDGGARQDLGHFAHRSADLSAVSTEPVVRLSLRLQTPDWGREGVRIDDLALVDRSAGWVPESLPVHVGFEDGPGPVRLEGGWERVDDGAWTPGSLDDSPDAGSPLHSSQEIVLLRRLDLRVARRPRLRVYVDGVLPWEAALGVRVESEDVGPLSYSLLDQSRRDDLFRPLELSLHELVGQEAVRLALVYRTQRGSERGLRIDDLEVYDTLAGARAELPVEDRFEDGLSRWRHIGWRLVEDPERPGDFAVTDSPVGPGRVHATASLELARRIDLSRAVRPRLVAWVRWELDAVEQELELDVLPSSGPVETVSLVGGGRQDRMRRLEVDLSPWAGDPAVGLRVQLVSGYNARDGVVLDDVRVEETPTPLSQPIPFHEDFDGDLDGWFLEGTWGRGTDHSRSFPAALDDSPDGATVLEHGTYRAALRRPLDLSGARRPLLTAWVRWDLWGSPAVLDLRLLGGDEAPDRTVTLAAGSRRHHLSLFEVDLSDYAGVSALGLELVLRNSGGGGLPGVAIDDLSVAERAVDVPVVAPWTADFNAPDDAWELQGQWGRTAATYASPYASLTDSPEGTSQTYGSGWARTRHSIDLSALQAPEVVWQCRCDLGDQPAWFDVLPPDRPARSVRFHNGGERLEDWHEHRVDLSEHLRWGRVRLRFRLDTEHWARDGLWIDDVQVREAE